MTTPTFSGWIEDLSQPKEPRLDWSDMTQQFTPGQRVYLVATGEVYNGQETYTRHEGSPPPLCDFETLYTNPAESLPVPQPPTKADIVALAHRAGFAGESWTMGPEELAHVLNVAGTFLPVQGEPVAALLRRIDAYLQGKSAETRAIIKDAAAFLRALPPAQPVQVPDADAITEKIAEMLAGTWHCSRVWEAWHVGTMSEDDFTPVSESDTPRDIADAICALLAASQPAAQSVEGVASHE